MRRLFVGPFVALAGITIHTLLQTSIDRLVTDFPSVPDVLLARLPYWDLYIIGEMVFWLYLALFAFVYFREHHDLAHLLILIGLFYGIRGLFLFVLPLGPPADAPPLADHFTLYPYPDHAFFPGGHVGLLILFALQIDRRPLRMAFLAAAVVFGVGSLLSRAHYTADLLGGMLLAYAVAAWGWHHRAILEQSA